MDPLRGQSGFDFIIVALALLTLLPIQWFTALDVMAGEQGRNSKPLTVNLIEPEGHINNDYVVKLLKLTLEDETLTLALANPNADESEFGTLTVKISAVALLGPLMKRALLGFVFGVCNAILLILVIWLIVHFVVTAPLVKLGKGVKAIGEGYWGKRISIDRNDELGDLARIGNTMAAELKQTFDNLSANEMKYRELVENVNDVIYTTDKTGVMTYISPRIESISGYQPKEIIGKPYSSFVYWEDLPELHIRLKKLLQGPLGPHEYRIVTKSGEKTWVRSSSRPLFNQGRIVGISGVLSDINPTKKLEAQLQQAQKLEAIGTLAGGIAHDFNNILASVIGYAELSLYEVEKGTPLYENLSQVLAAGNRAKDLVKQILAFSRRDEQQKKPFQINVMLKESLKMLRSTIPSSIEFKEMISEEPMILHADQTQIHQVIINLVTNAMHAITDREGVIEIGVNPIHIDESMAHDYSDITPGDYVRMSISDTGVGIPKEHLDRIFEPYFTTKEKGTGTGLGLSVVHGIIKAHEGHITAYSEPGRGTTFHVYLPLDQKISAGAEAKADEPLPTGSEHILLIDDEPTLALMHRHLLEHLGYRVTAKTDSREALEAFRTSFDNFSLVITDMTMPALTGAKLAHEIKKIRPDMPVILCTGFSEKVSENVVAELDIDGFMMKPIDKTTMAQTVRKVLDEAGQTSRQPL